MTDDLERVQREITVMLQEAQTLFVPGTKLTFVMRTPGDPLAEMAISNDDLSEVAATVMRCKEREEV